MGPTQFVVSGALTLIVYAIALFAVYKIFQIGSDVAEMKEMLRDIKRKTQEIPPAVEPHSPEAVIRSAYASYESLTANDQ